MTWSSPSPRLRLLRRMEVVVVTLLVLLAALASAAGSHAGGGVIGGVAGGVVAVGIYFDYVMGRRVKAWGYAEREDDLIVRRGVMFRRVSVIPYGRMQFVDVTAGPFERLMGLATVQLHTAAAASDARIPGLPADEAQRLRDQLATLGESRAAGL